jgi:hypothetical protein
MVISIKLPRLTLGTTSNVIGLLGLAAVVVAIGGLTGTWWWSLLAGGVAAVVVAYLTGQAAEADDKAELRPATAAAAGRPPKAA